MILECIDNYQAEHYLTTGKRYECAPSPYVGRWRVEHDKGGERNFFKRRFAAVDGDHVTDLLKAFGG